MVAADLHPGRVRTVRRAAARVGLADTVADDRRRRSPLPRCATAPFDRVLLDAPCSGLGVLRRRPDARWRVQPDDVRDLAALQRVLLGSGRARGQARRPARVRGVHAVERGDDRGRRVGAARSSPSSSADRAAARAVAPARSGRDPAARPTRDTDGMFVLSLHRASPASGDVASGR